MKEILENFNKYLLTESSLSRIWTHIQQHDTAVISAHRGDTNDQTDCVGDVSQELNNKERNKELKATLLHLGYGVTAVDGSFVEGFGDPKTAVEVKEDSFFVVNLGDAAGFNDRIIELSKHFCQDSVLLVPQGGKGAYLYGTNNDDFVGYDKTLLIGNFTAGKEAQVMTKVRGRPIVFKEGEELSSIQLETLADHRGFFKRMAIDAIARRILK